MKRGIILLLVLGLPLLLRAQNNSVETITLEEAIDLAVENNYQLKRARNNLDLTEYEEFSAKADFLPSVSGNINGSKRVGRQFNQNTVSFNNFTINRMSSSLDATLPIFTGFQNINNLRSSEYSTESQEETVKRVKEDVIFETASRYLQVLLDKELLQIAQENLESSRKQLEQVQAQVEVGSRPSVDLYNQEATVANNELEVTNRENNLQISRIQLVRTLQIDPLKQYEFSTPDISPDQLTPREYQLRELVNAALENRSDLQSARLNIKAIEHQLKATKGSLFPSLSFNIGISSSYSNQNFVPGSREQLESFNDQFFDQNVNRSLGLSLNIPIFDNFNRRTNVQSQLINYRNQQLSLENTELQVVQEVNQAYTDYQAVIKQLDATQKALRAAERSYETEKERYNVGATTLIELSNANAQYVQAQSDRARAVFNFVFQRKLLDYYIGQLDQNISLE